LTHPYFSHERDRNLIDSLLPNKGVLSLIPTTEDDSLKQHGVSEAMRLFVYDETRSFIELCGYKVESFSRT